MYPQPLPDQGGWMTAAESREVGFQALAPTTSRDCSPPPPDGVRKGEDEDATV